MEETWLALIRSELRGPLASLARLALSSASCPYGIGIRVRNALYDFKWRTIHRAAVPVVSVGNLTLGGTGKTPCVEYVSGYFRDHGLRVAILSRGYGATGDRNDEAMILEENLPDVPHLQDPDRVAAANRAVDELESELVVLDDGFQHRRLHRDLDIVLIDATRPPTRDCLFPRGTLREPVGGLRRAGALVLTRCDQLPGSEVETIRTWLARRFPDKPVATAEHRPTELIGGETPEPMSRLKGLTVGAFCGIGNPGAFRRTLEAVGADVVDFRVFPDHHAYTREDVDDLNRWAERLRSDAVIATTQKDWVKLRMPELGGRSLRAVRIAMTFRDGQREFDEALRRIVPQNP